MNVARRVLSAVAMVCCLISPVAARQDTGTIIGTVVEDGTLMPLFGTGDRAFRVAIVSSGGETSRTANTDATGHYEVQDLPSGTYYVKVTSAPGHVPEVHNNLACLAVDCPMTAGTAVSVTSLGTATVDFSLAKGSIITGTVRRAADATGIGNLLVNIYNSSTSFVKSAVTGASGSYIVTGLATGSYFARASVGDGAPTPPFDFVTELYGGIPCPHLAPESDCRIASGTLITVPAGWFTDGIDFALDKGASISGTVVADGAATPISGINVTAYVGDVAMGGALTNAAGQYTIGALPPGRYRVRTAMAFMSGNYVDEWQNGVCIGCPGAPATITVGAAQVVAGIDFSLAAGGTITGTLFCDTQSLPTAFEHAPGVAVFSSTGQLVRRSPEPFARCGNDAPFNYTINGLPTGTYFLLARDTPGEPFGVSPTGGKFVDQLYGGIVCVTADCDVRKGVPVAVTAGATTAGIHFALQLGGSVFFLPGAASAKLKVFDARGVEVVSVVGSRTITPTAQQFIVGLPPGTYYVTMNGLLNGSNCLDCPPTAGRPIVIGPDRTTSGEVTFAAPPRRLSGTITNAGGGAPLSMVGVDLVSGSGTVVASGITDLLGHYSIAGLISGTYFARTTNDRGFVDEVYSDAACGTCDARSGTPIVVPANTDVTGIDFALASGGTLTGLVSDTAGIVLENVPVSVFAGTNTFAGVKTTSASGRYRVTVPASTYRALAEASTKNGSEVYSEMPCTSAACDPSVGTPIALTTGIVTEGINFTLTSCSAMTLSPSVLATGVTGRAYRQVFSATGGTGPYRFDVTDGTLPLGVTLNNSSGILEGTPTVVGRSTLRVSVLDANGCATDRAYPLDVQPCAFTLSPTSATVPAAGGNVAITIANGCGSQAVSETTSWIAVQSNTPGQVTLIVDANAQGTPRRAAVAIGRRAFEIRQASAGSLPPYGLLEVPADGSQVSGAIAVGGWALDDLAVTNVRIYRDSVEGEPAGIIFVGTAVFIPGARPDVQQAAPGVPGNDRAGFGFLILTNTMPNQGNGPFRIHAVAEDAEGHSTLLGSRTIIGTNATAEAPFGTIDTPGQGETIAGAGYLNWGWALTPRPAMIPTDGSTIQVIVDGLPVGKVTYNLFRTDVSNTFPGLANSGGPVGYRAIDTTGLAEGLHTISWTVTDSRPATSGVGSRYFTVANSADAQPAGTGSVTATEEEAADAAKPIGAAPAPDMGRRAESLALSSTDATNDPSAPRIDDVLVQRGDGPKRRMRKGDDDTGVLTLAPMERLELALGAADAACPVTWAGYLQKDGVLSDLPVGASLDASGTFYWQTGPGFAGRFPLVFVRTDCRGEKQRLRVLVTIPNR